MAIKNYTSTKDIYSSLGDVQGALAKAGATKIMIDYEGGKPIAVTFALDTAQGSRGFFLSASFEGTERVFRKQNLKLDPAQIERTAWRNVRDWVLAQIALVESADIPVEEVFLPYLTDGKGTTLYQLYEGGRLPLMLGAESERPENLKGVFHE